MGGLREDTRKTLFPTYWANVPIVILGPGVLINSHVFHKHGSDMFGVQNAVSLVNYARQNEAVLQVLVVCDCSNAQNPRSLRYKPSTPMKGHFSGG